MIWDCKIEFQYTKGFARQNRELRGVVAESKENAEKKAKITYADFCKSQNLEIKKIVATPACTIVDDYTE